MIRAVNWASAFKMNARPADTYQRGRVFLTGDAAHCHPPTGGRGLNTSVQDACNLGWKLAAVLDGAPESLLSTYEKERRPIAEAVLGLSEKLLEAAKNRNIHRGREVSQLDLGYLDSPLTPAGPERNNGVLAGDRAPDAPVTGAGGLPTRLFSLFQGPHWTLLGHDVDDTSAPAPEATSSTPAATSIETYLDTVGVRSLAATRPPTTGSSSGMPAPSSSDSTGTPRTRREHRQLRTAAEQRLATAQRELHQLSRQVPARPAHRPPARRDHRRRRPLQLRRTRGPKHHPTGSRPEHTWPAAGKGGGRPALSSRGCSWNYTAVTEPAGPPSTVVGVTQTPGVSPDFRVPNRPVGTCTSIRRSDETSMA